MALYDLYALFQRNARSQGLKLRAWHDDRQLAALRNQGAIKLLNVPDATFVLGRTAADAKAFFLELDLGTESVSGRSGRRRAARALFQGRCLHPEVGPELGYPALSLERNAHPQF